MTEDTIEAFALERLEALRYGYTDGPTIAHDGEQPERESYEQVLLVGRLQEAVRRINPTVPALALEQAVKELARIASAERLVRSAEQSTPYRCG
jgi:type I restriction enzyme R subunit